MVFVGPRRVLRAAMGRGVLCDGCRGQVNLACESRDARRSQGIVRTTQAVTLEGGAVRFGLVRRRRKSRGRWSLAQSRLRIVGGRG